MSRRDCLLYVSLTSLLDPGEHRTSGGIDVIDDFLGRRIHPSTIDKQFVRRNAVHHLM